MTKRISILPVLLLAAAAAALVAGCGSSGDETITKAEFIKQAEVICKKTDNSVAQQYGEYVQQHDAQLKKEPPPPRNVKSITEIVTTIHVPTTMKEIDELEALEQPEGDEETLQKIYDGYRAGLEELNKDPQLVWASRAGNPMFPSFKAAQKYGFTACAEA